MSSKLFMSLTTLLMVTPIFSQQYYYSTQDDIVSIEAEWYSTNTGAWEIVEGRSETLAQGIGVMETSKILIHKNEILGTYAPVKIAVYDKPDRSGWGKPGGQHIVIATYQDSPDRSAVFAYDKGSKMIGAVAQGKRVGIFQPGVKLTSEAWDLFGGVIQWAAEGKSILMITGDEELAGDDLAIYEYLSDKGYKVKVIEDRLFGSKKVSKTDLIFISESISSKYLKGDFIDYENAIVVAETWLLNQMKMTGHEQIWNKKSGQNGNAVTIRYGLPSDRLDYSIFFNEGEYAIHTLGKGGFTKGSDHIRFTFNSIDIDNGIEVLQGNSLSWNRSDGYISVKKAGWYNLSVWKGGLATSSTDPGVHWVLDKIILSKKPKDWTQDGPPATLTNEVPPNPFLRSLECLPKQVFNEDNGAIAIEAEDLDYHSYWDSMNEPSGFSGEGYLLWSGPARHASMAGLIGNEDTLNTRQGPQEEWLVLRLLVDKPGAYELDIRNIHKSEDGDNDIWAGQLINGRICHQTRLGDSHKDGNGFTWLDWGHPKFQLNKGYNEVYLSGRSQGFGIDRIVLLHHSTPGTVDKDLLEKSVITIVE